jgi:hypothetical protein
MLFPLALFFQPISIFIIAIIIFIFIFYKLVMSDFTPPPPGEAEIDVTVFNEAGAPAENQEVTVTDEVGNVLGSGTTDIEGKAVIKINAEGNFNVNAGPFGTVPVTASFTGVATVTIGSQRTSRVYFSLSTSGIINYYLSMSGSGSYENIRSSSNY